MASKIPNLHSIYDCVIIGGGPAGLTCAIFLGRYRLRVLVIDKGKPRNYASHGVHGFLGQHGIKPFELLKRGREEAESVGVEFVQCEASKVEKVGDSFDVTSDCGVARARRVVLAYGVRDIVPDVAEFETYYGGGIHHCPDCDGYEVTDKKVGVIGWGKRVAGLSLKLLQWTTDLTVLTDGHDIDLSPEELSKLAAEGIGIRTEKLRSFTGLNGTLDGVTLEAGERIDFDSIFFTIGTERSCLLAEDTGCRTIEDAPCLDVDDVKQTSVEGVYAVGDLVPGSQLAITSAAEGAIAAIAINKSLLPPSRRV
ncbi:MAG TPA: NAD(P)/FAD-dependent oxidoreductase [Thermoanaerobaculia bacterium]|nr:NAD(P)/FAD-dependent oxidoreductase [Thermoanaerobaculia bacterium]